MFVFSLKYEIVVFCGLYKYYITNFANPAIPVFLLAVNSQDFWRKRYSYDCSVVQSKARQPIIVIILITYSPYILKDLVELRNVFQVKQLLVPVSALATSSFLPTGL